MASQTVTQSPEIAAIVARIPDAPNDVRGTKVQIAEVTSFIAHEFQPERIVLFGSRAYGTPTEESDIDLLVVMKTSLTISEQARRIEQALPGDSSLRVDIVVRTPRQIAVGLDEGDFFIEDMMIKGVTLYSRKILSESSGVDSGQGPYSASGSSSLKDATREWIRKADENASSAEWLLKSPDASFDNVCFLAQQCAEKYLKALLQQHKIRFERTHDLVYLADRCASVLPELAAFSAELKTLTRCAVDSRYPGFDITHEGALLAIQTMETVRSLVRMSLGIKPD